MANQHNALGNLIANSSVGIVQLPQEVLNMAMDHLYAVGHTFSRDEAEVYLFTCLY